MIKKILLGLLLTTILTGCEMSKGTTIPTTENNETTTQEPTTVEIETEETTTATEAPTEPPTMWYDEIDWSTKEEIKAEFDRIQVPDSIQKVIFDNNNVIVSKNGNSYYGKSRPFRDVTADFYRPATHMSKFRTVDMNQDGKNELIITVSSEGYFKYGRDVVLREFEDGKVCIYWFDVETEVSDTGYICYLDHNWNYSFYKPIFNGYEVVYEKVAWYDMDFFIEGNKVTREEYEEYLKPHDFHKLSYKDWVHLVYYIEKQ